MLRVGFPSKKMYIINSVYLWWKVYKRTLSFDSISNLYPFWSELEEEINDEDNQLPIDHIGGHGGNVHSHQNIRLWLLLEQFRLPGWWMLQKWRILHHHRT